MKGQIKDDNTHKSMFVETDLVGIKKRQEGGQSFQDDLYLQTYIVMENNDFRAKHQIRQQLEFMEHLSVDK